MKNLIPFFDPSFDVLTNALDRKTDAAARNAILTQITSLRDRFAEYDRLFATNTLETFNADSIFNVIKLQLFGLYGYNNVAVRLIRSQLESLQPRAIRYTCQYCTLESNEQMDHALSKIEFPEFSIHPKNLIPSCSKCNETKSNLWRANGVRCIINPYLDILPQDRYLFVRIFVDQFNELDFEYSLENRTNIPTQQWNLILSHFERLNLIRRMRNSAIVYLSELKERVQQGISAGFSRQSLTDSTIEFCNSFRLNVGLNHWKPAMEEALLRSNEFWDDVNIT